MTKEMAKSQLILLLENQVMDLVIMSKIELGDDVIQEIERLKSFIKEDYLQQISEQVATYLQNKSC